MEYKFNIGDEVEVIKNGWGVASIDIGKKVEIVRQGEYSNRPGYEVSPAIGNSLTGDYDGMIGEKMFSLVKKEEQGFKEGDWVRARGNIFPDFKIGKIVKVHFSHYQVDFINHPKINVDRGDWPTMRKALPHEIPVKEASIEELKKRHLRATGLDGILCDYKENPTIMQYLYLGGEWAQIIEEEYIKIPDVRPSKWEIPTILSAYQENKGVERLPKEVQFTKKKEGRRKLL